MRILAVLTATASWGIPVPLGGHVLACQYRWTNFEVLANRCLQVGFCAPKYSCQRETGLGLGVKSKWNCSLPLPFSPSSNLHNPCSPIPESVWIFLSLSSAMKLGRSILSGNSGSIQSQETLCLVESRLPNFSPHFLALFQFNINVDQLSLFF